MAGFNPDSNPNNKNYRIYDGLNKVPDKEKYPNAKAFDEKEPDYGKERKDAVLELANEVGKALGDGDAFPKNHEFDPKTKQVKEFTLNTLNVDGRSWQKDENSEKSYLFTISMKAEDKQGGLRQQGYIVKDEESGKYTAIVNKISVTNDDPAGKTVSGKFTPAKWETYEEGKFDLAKVGLDKAYAIMSGYVQERGKGNGFPQIYMDIRDYINQEIPKDKEVDVLDEQGKATGDKKMVRDIYVGSYTIKDGVGSFYINTHSDTSIGVAVTKDESGKDFDYALTLITRDEEGKATYKNIENLDELDEVKGGALVKAVCEGKAVINREEASAEKEENPFMQEQDEQEQDEK